jgi:hypothetical protein
VAARRGVQTDFWASRLRSSARRHLGEFITLSLNWKWALSSNYVKF